jgi:hypothetical protein
MRIRWSVMTVPVAVAVLGVSWGWFQAGGTHAGRVARPVPALTRAAPPAPPPTAQDILDRGAVLDLKADQRTRLRALEAKWTTVSAAADAELQAALGEFSRFMDEARAAGRTSVAEIQRRSAEIGELSAALREQRRRHAEAASEILTEWQRARLHELGISPARGEQR